MNDVRIRCDERDRLPARYYLKLPIRHLVDVWRLPEVSPPLRELVLRDRRRQDAPEEPVPGAILLMSLVLNSRSLQAMVVVDIHRAWRLEMETRDLTLRPVLVDSDIPSGAGLMARPAEGAAIHFGLTVEQREEEGLIRAVPGATYLRSYTLETPAGWKLPTVTASFAAPLAAAQARLAAIRTTIMGWRTPVMLVLPYLLMGAGALYLYYVNRQGTAQLENRLQTTTAELKKTQAALAAVAESEQQCQASRNQLSDQLDNRRLHQKTAAATSLAAAFSRSNTQLIAPPGPVPVDEAWTALLIDYLATLTLDPPVDPGLWTPCLAQNAVLASDLPPYVLLVSPAGGQCPDGAVHVNGPVIQAGRWGISQRLAREFGPAMEGLGPEPLLNDTWAAEILAESLRTVRRAMLTSSTDRPPVAPGEADAWSLALWVAYNDLPSLAEGLLDDSADRCISQLMNDLSQEGPAALNEPILPELSGVARGAALKGVQARPGCPWPSGEWTKAASVAVEAIGRGMDPRLASALTPPR